MKRINPIFPSELDPEFKFGVYDTENWNLLSTGKRAVYLTGKSQVVYREDNDNPMNLLFDEYKDTNVRRVWAITEDDVVTHDNNDYNYERMKKIIVINGESIQWNRSCEKNSDTNMHIRPVCTVIGNASKQHCMGVNIDGPSICIFNPTRHPLGMSIWMETNANLEIIK